MNNKIEILYDHYKDTFDNIKSNEKIRQTYFIISGTIIFLLILIMIHPNESINTISIIIEKQTGANIIKIFPCIVSALWIFFLYVLLCYYKICIHIERQYSYLHKLEEYLSNNALDKIFSREGKSYNNNYPILSSFIYILYNYVFPFLYVFLIVIKIINEYKNLANNNFVFDLIIGVLIVLLIILNFLSRISKLRDK